MDPALRDDCGVKLYVACAFQGHFVRRLVITVWVEYCLGYYSDFSCILYTQRLEECIKNNDKEGAEVLVKVMNEWELRGLTEGLQRLKISVNGKSDDSSAQEFYLSLFIFRW